MVRRVLQYRLVALEHTGMEAEDWRSGTDSEDGADAVFLG